MFRRTFVHVCTAGLLGASSRKVLASPSYQIVSGDLPPLTVANNESAPGALVEVVNAMAGRLGEAPTVQFFPWARALLLAGNQPRTLILPLTRTPEREDKFRWMAKLYHQDFVFTRLKLQGSGSPSLELLRDRKVAVLRGSPSVGHLEARHFSGLVVTSSVDDMIRLLQLGAVDAIYGSNITNTQALRQAGLTPEQYVMSKPVEGGDIWLGGSMDFTEAEASAWKEAMRKLMADGTYRRIMSKYSLKY